MMGGASCPPVDAVASMAPASVRLKPERIISGMVIRPLSSTLATALPETVPNKAEAMTAALPAPPQDRAVAP